MTKTVKKIKNDETIQWIRKVILEDERVHRENEKVGKLLFETISKNGEQFNAHRNLLEKTVVEMTSAIELNEASVRGMKTSFVEIENELMEKNTEIREFKRINKILMQNIRRLESENERRNETQISVKESEIMDRMQVFKKEFDLVKKENHEKCKMIEEKNKVT